MEEKEKSRLNFKGFIGYISSVISWTIFVILLIIGSLLLYYYISLQLYRTKGEKFEPVFSIYTIVSPSMEPNINVLDAIVNVKVNDPRTDIKLNDVITFTSTWKIKYGMTVTHRVVATQELDDGSICFITRGDNNPGNDEGCVKEENVIGVVKAVIPGLGKLQNFLASGFGWVFVVIIPALYVLIKDIFKIIKNYKKEDKEEVKDSKESSKKKLESANQNTNKKESNDSKNARLKNAYQDLEKIANNDKKGKKK